MSSFLWVEDFDTESIPATVRGVFGKLLGKLGNTISADIDIYELQDFLKNYKSNDITVALSLAHALSLIDDEKIHDFDYVVLDIDLHPFDHAYDRETCLSVVRPIIDRWYADCASDSEALAELKSVAGYHLWTRLVIELGFPRDRILFCSNHGDHLTAISSSFGPARIAPPKVFTKEDTDAMDWIVSRARESYSVLRRAVIDRCAALDKRVRKARSSADVIRMDWMAEDSDRALEFLETLPALLPSRPATDGARRRLLKSFCRALTSPWDEQNQSSQIYGRDVYDEIFSILKHARNAFSHSLDHLDDTDERTAAFLFLLALRSLFKLNPLDLTTIDRRLTSIFVPIAAFPSDSDFREELEASLRAVRAISRECASEVKFGRILICLQNNQAREYLKHTKRFLYQSFFHRLFDQRNRSAFLGDHRRWVEEIGKAIFNEAFEQVKR